MANPRTRSEEPSWFLPVLKETMRETMDSALTLRLVLMLMVMVMVMPMPSLVRPAMGWPQEEGSESEW